MYENTKESYDVLAHNYSKKLLNELDYKPNDKLLLDNFCKTVLNHNNEAIALDIGCGPGHVANYMVNGALKTIGIDLSSGMIEQAKINFPHVDFQIANMLQLPFQDNSIDGIVAFYSIIHLEKEDIPKAIQEFHRILKNNGLIIISFHKGNEIRHMEQLFDINNINLDFHFLEDEDIIRELISVGLQIEQIHIRDHYPEEAATTRCYITARKV